MQLIILIIFTLMPHFLGYSAHSEDEIFSTEEDFGLDPHHFITSLPEEFFTKGPLIKRDGKIFLQLPPKPDDSQAKKVHIENGIIIIRFNDAAYGRQEKAQVNFEDGEENSDFDLSGDLCSISEEEIAQSPPRQRLKKKREAEFAAPCEPKPKRICSAGYDQAVELAHQGSHSYSEISQKTKLKKDTVRNYLKIAKNTGDVSLEEKIATGKEGYKHRKLKPEQTSLYRMAEAINEKKVNSYNELTETFQISKQTAISYTLHARQHGWIELQSGSGRQFETMLDGIVRMIKEKKSFEDIKNEFPTITTKLYLNNFINMAYGYERLVPADCGYLKIGKKAEKNGVTKDQILQFLLNFLDNEYEAMSYNALTNEFNQSDYRIFTSISPATFGGHEKNLVKEGRITEAQRDQYLIKR